MLASFLLFCPPVWSQNRASAPATDIYNKAVRLYEKGKWESAREYLYQYLAEYSDSPLYVTCLYYLAYCSQQLGDTEEAISIYHKVLGAAQGGDAFWADMAEKRLESLSAQGS